MVGSPAPRRPGRGWLPCPNVHRARAMDPEVRAGQGARHGAASGTHATSPPHRAGTGVPRPPLRLPMAWAAAGGLHTDLHHGCPSLLVAANAWATTRGGEETRHVSSAEERGDGGAGRGLSWDRRPGTAPSSVPPPRRPEAPSSSPIDAWLIWTLDRDPIAHCRASLGVRASPPAAASRRLPPPPACRLPPAASRPRPARSRLPRLTAHPLTIMVQL